MVFKGIPFAEPPARFAAPERVRPGPGPETRWSYGPPPPQSGLLRHGRERRVSRRLVDRQRVDARPGREPAGDGVDPGWRLPVRHVRPARVRRRPAGARRQRRRRHVQLPGGDRGFRPYRRAHRPTAVCSIRSPRWNGSGTTSTRFGGDRDRVTVFGQSAGGRLRGRAPGDATGSPACSVARSCRACRARSSRQNWPPTSPASSRPTWV